MFTATLKVTMLMVFAIGMPLRAVAEKLGGSDSGGGGQGVYDQRTGTIHFVDLYTREELQQMKLVSNPESVVFSKFPKCTKVTSRHLHTEHAYQNAVSDAFQILEQFDTYIPKVRDLVYSNHFISRSLTSFHLKQLKDSTEIHPQYQIQIAIYKDGISYFQEQALALMPPEEVKWLIVKETLRFFAQENGFQFENAELEETIRLMYSGNYHALLTTQLYRQSAFRQTNTRKVVNGAEVQSTAELGQELSNKGSLGFIPPWALKIGENKEAYLLHPAAKGAQYHGFVLQYQKNTRLAPKFRAYDIETGQTVFDPLNECSN